MSYYQVGLAYARPNAPQSPPRPAKPTRGRLSARLDSGRYGAYSYFVAVRARIRSPASSSLGPCGPRLSARARFLPSLCVRLNGATSAPPFPARRLLPGALPPPSSEVRACVPRLPAPAALAGVFRSPKRRHPALAAVCRQNNFILLRFAHPSSQSLSYRNISFSAANVSAFVA